MSIFAELRAGLVAHSAEDTQRIAAQVATALPADRTIALQGDLGAGKTTFVKGLAAAWHVREAVTSPSFTVCNLHRGDRLLVHVDAYRLPGAAAWDALMVEEFLVSPWCLAIEWPERIAELVPLDATWITFEIRPDGGRLLRLLRPEVGA